MADVGRNAFHALMAAAKRPRDDAGDAGRAKGKARPAGAFAAMMAAAKSKWAGDKGKGKGKGKGEGKGKGKRTGMQDRVPYPCPAYRKVLLTPGFVCDGFCYEPSSYPSRAFFLTHFHSDHYRGLSGKWTSGLVFGSPTTLRLAREQLRVPEHLLAPLGMDVPNTVDGVRVTMIDANHCPGAVMFLFEPPGGKRILHVGDFRFDRDAMTSHAALCDKPIDILYLDTTYCDEQYKFPPQQRTLDAVSARVRLELDRDASTLFCFGSYSIGKERLVLAAARMLGRKVYVSAAKWRLMAAVDTWDVEALFTRDASSTNLWLVSMSDITLAKLASVLEDNRARHARIVGFSPTGWNHARGTQTSSDGLVVRRDGQPVSSIGVAYSEHSSFDELVDCVRQWRPARIIPTVSVRRGDEHVRLLRRAAAAGVQ